MQEPQDVCLLDVLSTEEVSESREMLFSSNEFIDPYALFVGALLFPFRVLFASPWISYSQE